MIVKGGNLRILWSQGFGLKRAEISRPMHLRPRADAETKHLGTLDLIENNLKRTSSSTDLNPLINLALCNTHFTPCNHRYLALAFARVQCCALITNKAQEQWN